MKQVSVERTDLELCVSQAQRHRVVITRQGKPVALLVGVKGLDREQLALGSADKFWKLITQRRKQGTISRAELERRLRDK